MHDALTGIYNRRAAMPLVNEAMKRVQGSKAKYALMLIDLDSFKRVNDRHGHTVGDEVLMMLAKKVSGLLRSGDVFARWGGEEFLLLARIEQDDDAHIVAEKIRSKVEESEFGVDGLKVTVSIGVVLTATDSHFDALFQCADKALYEAKQQGRNRVQFAASDR
jgi:diguanylate cyclase (GGDEF)-like protein